MPRSKKKWTLDIFDSLHPELGSLNIHGYLTPVYEPIWQGIRLSLSFRDYEGVRRSLVICQSYLDRATGDLDNIQRLLRVRNLLNAIPLYDWRQDANSVDAIQELVSELQRQIELTDKIIVWDWNTARTQAHYMYANTREMFNLMHQDCRWRRTRTSGPKNALHYFLDILQEVIDAQGTT